MLLLLSTWTYEAGLPSEARIPGFLGRNSHNHQWDMHRHSLFLLTPVRARGTSISPKVLHMHLLLHKQAREARVWVEVEDRAHKPRLKGPRGVSTPLHHK